jgi:osmoprotectant transport system permease protein
VGEVSPQAVAKEFLESLGIKVLSKKTDKPDIVIGSKNFTENFILAEMFAMLIESESELTVELKQGFGGTKLLFEALQSGGVDLYPEYTGTGLLVLIQPGPTVIQNLGGDPEKVYEYVMNVSKENFDMVWMQPLGFNNTTALMMQEAEAERLKINTISGLQEYLVERKTD